MGKYCNLLLLHISIILMGAWKVKRSSPEQHSISTNILASVKHFSTRFSNK